MQREYASFSEKVDRPRDEWDRAHHQGKQFNGGGRDISGLHLCAANGVKPEPIEWLWHRRLAAGKLTLLAGDPGLGKSQVTIDVAARITKGSKWPDHGSAPRGRVLMLSAEDSLKDTINPRLHAANADLAMVTIVEFRRDAIKERTVNLREDLSALTAAIAELGDVKLVVIDPITAYLGSIDSHRTTDVRAVLEPLARMAEETRIAILAVTHPPKAAQQKAIHAITGSLAYVAAGRIVLIAIEDPEADRKLLLCAKNNLAPFPAGLGFNIEPATIGAGIATSRVAWDGLPVNITANEAVQASTKAPTRKDEAIAWLREHLASGPKAADPMIDEAEAEGINERTLRRARKELGVIAFKADKFQGAWWWRLPQ